jgi:class 3 adenylate cyclase
MASDQVKRKLAAILAADIVGYSRLLGTDEQKFAGGCRSNITAAL